MRTHWVYPTDSLTWDDVCQLWDNGFYTTEDVKRIATLYFDSAELPAVLEVIENVDNESLALATINIAPESDMTISMGAFDCLEFENVHILIEPDCDYPRRVLH